MTTTTNTNNAQLLVLETGLANTETRIRNYPVGTWSAVPFRIYQQNPNANLTNWATSFNTDNTVSFSSNVTVNGNILGNAAISAVGNITGGNLSVTGTTVINTYIETTAANVNTGTSFTPVWTSGPVQQITATANFTLNAPTGMATGSSITLVITQDATGNRIMTPDASYKFAYGVKTLSTAVSSTDVMSIFYTGSSYLCNLVKGYV